MSKKIIYCTVLSIAVALILIFSFKAIMMKKTMLRQEASAEEQDSQKYSAEKKDMQNIIDLLGQNPEMVEKIDAEVQKKLDAN